MLFDPQDKKNKIYLDYFQEKKVLIVDPQKSIRTNLKKIILDFGVVSVNLAVVETIDAARKWIKTKKPNFVFTSFLVGDEFGIDLIDDHKEIFPNRLEAGFYLLSNASDHSAACAVLEKSADFFMSQPFTVEKMTKAIISSIGKKVQPTPYQLGLTKSRILIAGEKYDEALACLERAELEATVPVLCYFYRGEIHRLQGNQDQAIDFYQKGLSFQLENYHCLSALTDAYYDKGDLGRSYEYMETLINNFPVSVSKFPRFIELILKNKKFQNIFQFAEIFEGLSEHEMDQGTKDKLVEGFLAASQGLLESGEKEIAMTAALKAIEYTQGALPILKETIPLIIQAGNFSKAEEIINRFEKTYADQIDFKIIQLDAHAGSKDFAKTLTIAMQLMREKVDAPRVYEIAITTAQKMGRNKEFIEDLAFQAGRAVPDKREHFLKLAND